MFTREFLGAIVLNFLCFGQCGPLQAAGEHSRIKRANGGCFDFRKTTFSTEPTRIPETINYYKCKDKDCSEVSVGINVRYINGTNKMERIVLDCVSKTRQPTIDYTFNNDYKKDRIPQSIIHKKCIKGPTRYTKIPTVLKGKMEWTDVGLGCKKSTDDCNT